MKQKYSQGFVGMLLLIVIIVFAVLLSGGLSFKSRQGDTITGSLYTCCDSGDGDTCRVSDTERFVWKGTNTQPQEYALIKTDITLLERSGHLAPARAPDDKTPKGDRIFLNVSNERFPNGHEDSPSLDVTACKTPGQDMVFKSTKGLLVCQGIPNDEIIYVCKSNCEGFVGTGKFDAYYRVSDQPIPDVIKNCEKPDANTKSQGKPTIIIDPQDKRTNLQLQTFKIVQNVTASWLSPYCKPAVYLYPETTSLVKVKVASNEPLTYTDPAYPAGGWIALAEPGGLINYQNKQYDYLYYETKAADSNIQKPTEGFVVEKSELVNLFSTLLPKLGLNIRETKQFSDYWVNILPESPYFFVGIIPQTALTALTTLNISPKPATQIRVTLYFEPLKQKIDIAEPQITTPARSGFTVVEWGGIFKKTFDSNFSCLQ